MLEWTIIAALVVLIFQISGVNAKLLDLNHNTEHWGQAQINEVQKIIGALKDDLAMLEQDVGDIARRIEEHYPTTREIERRHDNPL